MGRLFDGVVSRGVARGLGPVALDGGGLTAGDRCKSLRLRSGLALRIFAHRLVPASERLSAAALLSVPDAKEIAPELLPLT